MKLIEMGGKFLYEDGPPLRLRSVDSETRDGRLGQLCRNLCTGVWSIRSLLPSSQRNSATGLLMETGVGYNKQRLHKLRYFTELRSGNDEMNEIHQLALGMILMDVLNNSTRKMSQAFVRP
jgi:hypothetical protein